MFFLLICSGVKRKSEVLGTGSASSTSPDAVAEPIVATATKRKKPGQCFFIERVLCPTTKKKSKVFVETQMLTGHPSNSWHYDWRKTTYSRTWTSSLVLRNALATWF